MRNIWIISDTHFRHANSLKFLRNDGTPMRPGFDNVQQMDEFMLHQWNSVVKPGDLVYHVGDVMMGPKEDFVPFFNKLHGGKRLIVGNHDDIKWIASTGMFQKIMMWRMFPEFNILMSHVPLHSSSLNRGNPDNPLINVHGHIHHNDSPEGPYVNVCVEKLNYTPIHIDEVKTLWKTQQESRSELLSTMTDVL